MKRDWRDELPEVDRKALEELGFIKPKPKRQMHRCFECGKVTKHIFCPECHKQRIAKEKNTER